MSIVDRIKEKKVEVEKNPPIIEKTKNLEVNFSLDELEFMIRLIGSSNFKGNDLMFIYDLVNKLQNLYLDRKGVE
tara:strand:- start:119 stop:343 length:225 start_codon:yes stop_codon:yes gene_type:complete